MGCKIHYKEKSPNNTNLIWETGVAGLFKLLRSDCICSGISTFNSSTMADNVKNNVLLEDLANAFAALENKGGPIEMGKRKPPPY